MTRKAISQLKKIAKPDILFYCKSGGCNGLEYILEPTDKDGNTINSEHIRMKGIPTSCIQYYAEQHNITVLDLFKQLYDNKTIKFDLTNDGNKFVCRNNKDYTISNVSDFTRRCKYIRDENDKVFIN